MRTVVRAAALAATLSCIMASAAPALALEPRDHQKERASRQGRTAAQSRDQVAIVLESVTPKNPKPGSKISVTGTVTNRSGQPLPAVQANLRYSAEPAGSRSQLTHYAATPPSQLAGVAKEQPLTQSLAAGATQRFTLVGDTAAMGLTRFGAYPVGIDVTSNGQPMGASQTTFVTFVPKGRSVTPVKVAWVWPIAGSVYRANDQTFMNDRLAGELAARGRLTGLVNAAAKAKGETKGQSSVTWAIDPGLLDDARAMTAENGYTIKSSASPRAKATRKPQSRDAASWLAALQAAYKSDDFFSLPYADPDVVALVRHKLGGHITTAYKDATTVNAEVLKRQPNVQMAWPPSGAAGRQTLTQLTKSAGLDPKRGTFIMSSREFPQPQTITPTATTTVPTDAGLMRAVAYDEGLSDLLSGNTRSPGSALLVEQRFLAETATIAAESPTPRTLVVAPDRRWNPDPELAKRLLVYSAKAEWLNERTSVSEIGAGRPGQAIQGYSGTYQKYELGELYLRDVQAIARRAQTFQSILNPEVNPYQRALLRLESAYWRGRSSRAINARTMVDKQLDADMAKLHVVTPTNGRITVAGNSGRFNLTIANDSRDKTVRFRFEVVSQSPGLQIGRLDAQDEKVILLNPGQKHSARIPVQASGNGNFQIHVQLYTPTGERGKAYGTGANIAVRSTLYGRQALLITGGALAVLFVGVGVRAIRARRRRNAEDAGDGSTGMGSAGTTGSPGTGFPGDGSGFPAESAFPSGPEFPGGTGLHTGPGAGTGTAPGTAGPSGPSGATGPSGTAWPSGDGAGTGSGSVSGPGAGTASGSATGPVSRADSSAGAGPAPWSDAAPWTDAESWAESEPWPDAPGSATAPGRSPGSAGPSGPGGSAGPSGDGPSSGPRWDGDQS